jgi:hypothetical protein
MRTSKLRINIVHKPVDNTGLAKCANRTTMGNNVTFSEHDSDNAKKVAHIIKAYLMVPSERINYETN